MKKLTAMVTAIGMIVALLAMVVAPVPAEAGPPIVINGGGGGGGVSRSFSFSCAYSNSYHYFHAKTDAYGVEMYTYARVQTTSWLVQHASASSFIDVTWWTGDIEYGACGAYAAASGSSGYDTDSHSTGVQDGWVKLTYDALLSEQCWFAYWPFGIKCWDQEKGTLLER